MKISKSNKQFFSSLYTISKLALWKTILFMLPCMQAIGQRAKPFNELKLFCGSTHAHSIFTISHGSHLGRDSTVSQDAKTLYVDSLHLNRPVNVRLNPNWHLYQGLPEAHFGEAKKNGYDFFCVTDHSQEEAFYPNHPFNTAWLIEHQQAKLATDSSFIAIIGVEHSENDGPGGKGHINILNAKGYLNALADGIDLPALFQWLKTVKPYEDGPVVAVFNHPMPDQYDHFAGWDEEVNKVITMFEMINGNKSRHYEGFLSALDKGWKVSPVFGSDNHNLANIGLYKSRTFVLAASKTKKNILEAMQKRRTYASLEVNLECRYTINDSIMGSVIPDHSQYQFDIFVTDPDKNITDDRITRVDIITDQGKVADSLIPAGYHHTVRWNPVVKDNGNRYFFVRVWNEGGGDNNDATNRNKPVAWLAPVWIERK